MTHVLVISMYGDVIMVSPARYGLPVNYQALLLQTDGKRSKKLGEELSSLFMHLDPTATASKADVRGHVYYITVFHLKPQDKRHKHAACGAWVILEVGLSASVNTNKSSSTDCPLPELLSETKKWAHLRVTHYSHQSRSQLNKWWIWKLEKQQCGSE